MKTETQDIFHQRTFVILSATLEWQGEIVSWWTVAVNLEKCMWRLLFESQMNNRLKLEEFTLLSSLILNLTPDSVLVLFFSWPPFLCNYMTSLSLYGLSICPTTLHHGCIGFTWVQLWHPPFGASPDCELSSCFQNSEGHPLKVSSQQQTRWNQASVWQSCHPYLSGLRTPYEVRKDRWNSAWHSTLLSWQPDLDGGKESWKTIKHLKKIKKG